MRRRVEIEPRGTDERTPEERALRLQEATIGDARARLKMSVRLLAHDVGWSLDDVQDLVEEVYDEVQGETPPSGRRPWRAR